MASEEYFDLYLSAQKNPNAIYHVVSFDLVDSRKIPIDRRMELQVDIFRVMKSVYEKLLEKEKELGRAVVIKDERFYRPWDDEDRNVNGNFCDPFIFGDNFQFTVLRGTVSKEEIVDMVNECLSSLNVTERFHIADGYYETNEYAEGGTRFYRGYCLNILGRLHKSYPGNKIKRLKRGGELS